jgi:hypothetical protein
VINADERALLRAPLFALQTPAATPASSQVDAA